VHKVFYYTKPHPLDNELEGDHELNMDWLLQAAIITSGLVFLSFIVIAILYWYAHKQLESFHKREEEPKINLFWMEKILSTRFEEYILLAVILSFGTTIADCLVPVLVAGRTPWWWAIGPTPIAYNISFFILLNFALIMGFLVPRQLYHYFMDETLQDMMDKAKHAPQHKKIIRTLKMFSEVAGGSLVYQGTCVLVACVLFISINLFFIIPQWQEIAGFTRGLDVRPLLGSWSVLLIYILIGGVVGPMATTISAFIIFCSISLKNEDFFDPLAKDRRGGFRSLGTLGMWSSFMAAVTPGVAIPALFLDSKPKTIWETAISGGLLFFLTICVVLFFFVPIFYVHVTIKASRKHQIRNFEGPYRTRFNEFVETVKDGRPTKMAKTLSMLALKEIYNDITVASDWPMDYLTVLKVITSAILPVLSYVIKLLSLG